MERGGYINATGEEEATDSYLENVAGAHPTKKKPEQMSTAADADGTTWYTNMNGNERRYHNNCARIFVIVFSVILLLAGMGIAILGRVEKDHKVLPLCPSCKEFVTVMYIFGSCLALFALLGIGSAVTRMKPLAILYTILLVLLAIALIGAGFAIVAYDTGLKESEVERLWTDAVSDEEQFICDLQEQLHCSGFTKCCSVYPGTNTSTMACNATRAEYIAQCDQRCKSSNNKYVEPCNHKVEDLVKSHFKPLIGVTFGVGFLLIFVAIASVRMTLRSSS